MMYTDKARGPDLSIHNAVKDLTLFDTSGLANIIGQRASYGRMIDPTFAPNNAINTPLLPRILYHWYDSTVPLGDQVSTFKTAIGSDRNFIVALDFEAIVGPVMDAAVNALSWMSAIDSIMPRRCVLYTNYSMASQIYRLFNDRDLWIAWPISIVPDPDLIYPQTPAGWTKKPFLWQYSWTTGNLPGISDQMVDYNVSYMTRDQFMTYFSLEEPSQPIPPEPLPANSHTRMKVVVSNLGNYDHIQIRKGPGQNYDDIGDLPDGAVIEILNVGGDTGAWVYHKTPGLPAGWSCVQLQGKRYMEPVE